MGNSIATAFIDLKIDTTGLQQGLNRVKGTLAGSSAAISGAGASTASLATVGLAAGAAMSIMGTKSLEVAKKAKILSAALEQVEKWMIECESEGRILTGVNKYVSESFKKWSGELRKTTQQLNKARTALEKFKSRMNKIKTAVAGAKIKLAAIAVVLGIVVKKSFAAAAEIETLTNKFINLGVSAAASKEHMKELQEYTNKTSFDIASVAKASAILYQFSDGALGGIASVKLIGEAADVAGKPINDIAVQVGKLYAALSAGGEGASEPLNVLRDMGAVTAETAGKMKQLMKVEGKQKEIFKLMTDDMQKRAGASERSATSLAGTISTMKDAWKSAWAEMGKALEPVFKFIIKMMSGIASKLKNFVRDVRVAAYVLGRGRGVSAGEAYDQAMGLYGYKESDKGKGFDEENIEFKLSETAKAEAVKRRIEKEKEAVVELGKLQESYAEKVRVSNLERMSAEEKLIALNKFRIETGLKTKILAKSEEERYKAKEKLLDIEKEILSVQEEEVNTFRSAQTSMAALRDKVAKEQADSSKGLGFTGKFVGGEEAVKFAQSVQHDSIKAQEEHNKKMEEYQKEEIKIQTDFAKRGGETVEAIKKLYDLIKGGELELGVAL